MTSSRTMSDLVGTGRRVSTPEDLFAIHLVSDPQPSPDGSRVAYVLTRLDQEIDDYRSAIWVVATDGGEPTQLTAGSARDSSPRWSPDGLTLAFVSSRTAEPGSGKSANTSEVEETKNRPVPASNEKSTKPKPQIWLIRVDGGEARQLTRQPHGATSPVWSPDGATIAFLSAVDPSDDERDAGLVPVKNGIADERVVSRIRYRRDGSGFIERFSQLWTIPASGGNARPLTSGDADAALPAWSPDGARIAFVSNRTPERELNTVSAIYVIPAVGGDVRCLTEGDVAFTAPAWSPDGTRIAFIGHLGQAASDIRNVNIWTVAASGGEPTSHTANWDRSFDDLGMSDVYVAAENRPVWAKDGKAIYALASDQGATHVYRVGLEQDEVTAVTSGARRITSVALAGNRKLVYSSGDVIHPFELFVAGLDGDKERPLTDHNRAFREEVILSPAEELRFTSQDGETELQGWILKPPSFKEASGVKYPLIVQIHGGPHAMYGNAMFHEMQLMAARGYVVLFTNPRGSGGYGEAFTGFTRGRWGETDMPDIMGALDAVLDRGYVDEARVGITGGSYGGYLTNWIIGHSDRFKAAVTQRCVSNFHSMYGTSDIGFDFGEVEFGGNPWDDAERLLKYSPISYVDKMTTPLLIIHNEQDLRCPIEQAEQLFIALKRLERTVTFVRIPDEDHNLSRSGTPSRRLARLHHLIGWFDARL